MVQATVAAGPRFEIERTSAQTGASELVFRGEFGFADASAVWQRSCALLDDAFRSAPGATQVGFNLADVRRLDGGTAALILELADEVRERGGSAQVVGATGKVREILDLYAKSDSRKPEISEERIGILDQVGRSSLELRDLAIGILDFIGDVVVAAISSIRSPSTVRWRAVGRLMERTGADALPIVLLMTFLMGLVFAFQSAAQLKQVGANIFVADLVAILMTRELGPLMTAVIAAGRSGAAFAAELGTMRVSEEVDALETLELDPYRFLVFPRILALVLVVPLLTICADAIGILGGLVVGVVSLDLTPTAFLIQTQGAISIWDVFSGVLKAMSFALAIALIACQRGLATSGGAEGVGRSTTSAVVTILFALIVIDAAFTVVFHVFGL